MPEPDSFRLESFQRSHWPEAREMLNRGYFQRASQVLWDAAFQRLNEVPPGPLDDPLGVLMRSPQGAVHGVGWLIRSRRPGAPGQVPVLYVNASGWAIDPAERQRALWMCRLAMPDPAAVYTALTPIPSTERMLQRLGFKPSSHQRVRVFTPRLLGSPGPGRQVLQGAAAVRALQAHPLARAFDDHLRLGCHVFAVEQPEDWLPLVLVGQRRLRMVPVAEVLYAPSHAALRAALPALAGPLLLRGVPFIEFDADEAFDPELPCTRLFRRRFARGPVAAQGIDHLYSELVYILR